MQGAAKASPQEKEKSVPATVKRKSAAALKAEKAEKAKQKAAKVGSERRLGGYVGWLRLCVSSIFRTCSPVAVSASRVEKTKDGL